MKRAFTHRQRRIIRIRDGNVCQKCGKPLEADFHADHVQPYSKGGKTILMNAQALCPACNLSKGAKDD